MLEKLFTSKNRIKLLEFFLIAGGSGRLREISRKLKIPTSFLSKELKNLTLIGLIIKDSSIYRANRGCNFLEDLKNILLKTDSLVYPLSEALSGKQIKFAFIFGSFARGSYHAESDVDLMVVGDIKLSGVYSLP